MGKLELKPINHNSQNDLLRLWAMARQDFENSLGIETDIDEIVDESRRIWKEREIQYEKDGILKLIPKTNFLAYFTEYDGIQHPAGFANLQYRVHDTNNLPVLCYFYIYVLGKYQRKGVGTALLRVLIESASKSTLQTIFTFAEDQPSSLFLESVGGKLTEEGYTYQLVLDQSIAKIQEKYQRHESKEYEYEIVENPGKPFYQDILETYFLSKQNEPGSETFDNEKPSTDELFSIFTYAGHYQIFGVVRSNGEVICVSNVIITDSYNDRAFQKYTGTHPDFSGKGVATFLKANLCAHIANKHPDIKYIQTEAVANNVASIRVNEKLGYQKVGMEFTYEFLIDH